MNCVFLKSYKSKETVNETIQFFFYLIKVMQDHFQQILQLIQFN